MSFPHMITVRVDEHLFDQIEKFSANKKLAKSDAVRAILAEYFELNRTAAFEPDKYRLVKLIEFNSLCFQRLLNDEDEVVAQEMMDAASKHVEMYHD